MDTLTKRCFEMLRDIRFDIRRKLYEDDDAYHLRIIASAAAFSIEYRHPKWSSIENWVDICPLGGCRLPGDKRKLPPHLCHFLKLSDVIPENWIVPTDINEMQAQKLPKRAIYRPSTGDILLSRFKEPMGKCVLFLGEPNQTYVNSNFFLLRPKKPVSPFLVLSFLKSSFIARQLHSLIRQRSVITEMFQYEVPSIMLPNVSQDTADQLCDYVHQIITLERNFDFKRLSKSKKRKPIDDLSNIGKLGGKIDGLLYGFSMS